MSHKLTVYNFKLRLKNKGCVPFGESKNGFRVPFGKSKSGFLV